MRWRRLVWTGVSGLLFGVAALVARKRFGKRRRSAAEPIPDDIQWLSIETEKSELSYRGQSYWTRAVYTCYPTRFQVWSLLKGPVSGKNSQGFRQRIYHVSPVIEFHSQESEDLQSVAEEKFYATIHLDGDDRRGSRPDHVALGGILEFHKCHVGGSMNGVETGEKVLTPAPVAKVKFAS